MRVSGADWIGNGLAHCVGYVLRFRKTTILLGFALAILCVYYAANNLGINTDTANMISAELAWRQHFIEYRENFEIRDRNLVVVIDAPTAQQASDFATALARALRAEPELFRSVFLAGEGEFFERNGLLYLSVAELEGLADRLVEAQPLLGLLQRRFNGAGVIEVVTETIERAQPQVADSEELSAFYAELTNVIEAAAAGRQRPMVWRQLIAGNDEADARQILLLQPTLDFNRIQPAGNAIERIRAVIEQLKAEQPDELTVRVTGTIAMEHEELVSVSRGASVAGIMALILVTLVLYWALRSVWLMAISVVTLLVGLTATAAFAAAAIGHLNLISVAFAVLYVGLGVDFILHLCLRFKELLREGQDSSAAIVETVRGVGASLVICASTTAAAFYAFIPTPFEGVSELGLISGTGMFISLIVSLTLLPAMLSVFISEPEIAGQITRADNRFVISIMRYPKRIVVAAIVVAGGTFSLLPRVSFDSNPIHLRNPASESVVAITQLAADSEAPLLNLVALADDHRTALRWAAELEDLRLVRRVETVDSLVPEDQLEKQFLLQDLALVLGPGFGKFERLPADSAELRAQLESLQRALNQSEQANGVESSLRQAVEDMLARVNSGSESSERRAWADLDRNLTVDLQQQLGRLAVGLQAQPFDLDELPNELAERWINPAGKELIEIVAVENVNENDAAQRFVDAVRTVVPNATGLPVVYTEASATVVQSFQLAFMYALILVSALLLVFLRRLSDALLVLAPILFAAGATAGMTVWLGIPFNFANIIALPLLLGVGVDNGIHMVHRMRTEPPVDGEPFSTSTSRAVLASGLTTIASFGNLAFSAHIGMASMGKLLTLGMLMTLAATLLLLPALLKIRADS